tara:strand:- start:612 stop:1010 length:399 start_codon:yes stop_codon:yes gene_type:complete
MNQLYKKASKQTPLVSFNSEKGVLVIDGNCNLDDPTLFFHDLSEWINQYANSPAEKTLLTINIDSINISNSKFILNIIYQIDSIYKSNFDAKIRWVFRNDEDGNYELGNDYAEMVSVPFEFIETVKNFMTTI